MISENKINILYVITKLELGGAQKHLLSLIQGMDRKQFNLFLFAATDGLLVGQALNIPGLDFHRCRFLERRIHPFKDLLTFIELYFFIKKNKIQIVHTHSSKAGILGRLAASAAGVKVIVHTVHGWGFHEYQAGFLRHFYVFLERICAKFTNKFIVVSQSDKNKGLHHRIGSADKYAVIRYGINRQNFRNGAKRDEIRRSLGIDNSEIVVGMVACFKPQKAPLDFVKVAFMLKKTFPRIKFVLVGDGELRGEIARMVKNFSLEKSFILPGWRHDIPLVLSAFDVFVLTSWWEGLPIVVLEAMAAGVPVVATDTGGIREVILSGETGYLVQPKDIESLKEKISELLDDDQARENFALRATRCLESSDFSQETMQKNIEQVYLDS
jgi:glycosyltransferase involved in cell wall biosynthesis